MALVGKSGGERDLAERRFGRRNLPVSKFNPQTAHVFADRAAEFPAKNARQMNRMNTRDLRDVFEHESPGKVIVQKISGSIEPARKLLFIRDGLPARGFRQNFQDQAFDRERGKSVRLLKFPINFPSEMIDIFRLQARGFLQNRRVPANRGETPEIELDA